MPLRIAVEVTYMGHAICCDTKSSPGMKSHRLKGGVIAVIGFVLSPLSWWNDLFVNIPLAYVLAWPFERISPGLFLPAMIAGYWLTNIVGLVMLHRGAVDLARKERPAGSRRRQLVQDLLLSVLYTSIIVALVKTGVLLPPSELLHMVL